MFSRGEKELKKLYIFLPEYFSEIKSKLEKLSTYENAKGLDAILLKIINSKNLNPYQKYLFYRDALVRYGRINKTNLKFVPVPQVKHITYRPKVNEIKPGKRTSTKKAKREKAFDQSRLTLADMDVDHDETQNNSIDEFYPAQENLMLARSSNIDNLFTTEVPTNNEQNITVPSDVPIDENLEISLHQQAQEFLEEPDPTNIVRVDTTLDKNYRSFVHLPSQAEIVVPVPDPQQQQQQQSSSLIQPDILLTPATSKETSLLPVIRQSRRKSFVNKSKSTPIPSTPSILLRNRSVKRRTTDSIETIRKNLKEEKKKIKLDKEAVKHKAEKFLRVARRRPRALKAHEQWDPNVYTTAQDLEIARTANLVKRTKKKMQVKDKKTNLSAQINKLREKALQRNQKDLEKQQLLQEQSNWEAIKEASKNKEPNHNFLWQEYRV